MLWRKLDRIAFLLTLCLATTPVAAANRCKLVMTPPVPVSMESLRPVISANIDGVEERFIIDTGSFFDFLSPAAATELKLPMQDAPPWYYVNGIGGSFVPRIATAKTFEVAGMTGRHAEFLVGDNDFQGGVAGILGQNILRVTDIDYDFADGVLRFVKPQHCGDNVLAYWATTQSIGVVDLHWTSEQRPHLTAKASVNGHEVEVVFDTGASRTILSLDAAKHAGITPDSPGVVPAGVWYGLGHKTIKVWAIPVATFEIGGEKIEHTHVLMGDIDLPQLGADMLLGSDFFLAHHVYVAYSQDKLYFTYNGGTVFDLNARPPAQATGATAGTPPASAQPAALAQRAAPAQPMPGSDVPTDAAGFLRRGMAYASRGELDLALADLTHAAQLDPHDPQALYQRGLVYWRDRKPQPALADFNAALALDANDYQAHFARAGLQLPKLHAGIEDDLDAVDHLAPQEADIRLGLGNLYHLIGQYAAAVHQYDLWIEYHGDDLRLPSALSTRCGLQAAANIDLDRALDDCNQALKRLPASNRAAALSNRSLVYLRLGRLDDVIADATASIQLRPQSGYALYVRGLAELRKGLMAQGKADLAAAKELQPDIARHYAAMGLTP